MIADGLGEGKGLSGARERVRGKRVGEGDRWIRGDNAAHPPHYFII